MHHEDQAEAALRAAHTHTLKQIEPTLNKLYDEMMELLVAGDQIPAHWLYEANRLEVIKKLVTNEVNIYGALAQTMVGRLQQDGVRMGLDAGLELLKATVPKGINFTFGVPSPKAIADLIGATQRGSPLANLFAGWGEVAAKEVTDALTTGITLGNNPRVVARVVQSVMRGKAGIALRESRNRALTISRTELNRAYRSANLETYRANSDVCESWVWVASLSKRTCIACIMMNGTVHPLSEEMKSHVCCRCSPSPRTRSWSDILSPLGIDASDIPDTRVSIPSGEAWFMQQSEGTQKRIFNNNRLYQTWKDGKFDLSEVVGYTHSADWGDSVRVKSVKEMVK